MEPFGLRQEPVEADDPHARGLSLAAQFGAPRWVTSVIRGASVNGATSSPV